MTEEMLRTIIGAAGLLTGGLGGAALNAYLAARKARVPVIHYALDVTSIFRPRADARSFSIRVLSPADREVSNLHLVRITLSNRSGHDFKELAFGFTLGDGDLVVDAHHRAVNRHRKISMVMETEDARELDLVIAPFNRGDDAEISLLVSTRNESHTPGAPQLSSTESVRFERLGVIPEDTIAAVRSLGRMSGVPGIEAFMTWVTRDAEERRKRFRD